MPRGAPVSRGPPTPARGVVYTPPRAGAAVAVAPGKQCPCGKAVADGGPALQGGGAGVVGIPRLSKICRAQVRSPCLPFLGRRAGRGPLRSPPRLPAGRHQPRIIRFTTLNIQASRADNEYCQARYSFPEAFGVCGSRGPLACVPPVTTSRAIVGPRDRDRSVWNCAGTTVMIVFFREKLYSPSLKRRSRLCFHAKGSIVYCWVCAREVCTVAVV